MNIEAIKKMGVKITKRKLAILELFKVHRHLDANKIHSTLVQQGSKISLATVYRILTSFEAQNIVIKHNFNEGVAIYELANPNEHHDHLICIKCNTVLEFFNCQIEQIQERIAQEKQFVILNHHLNLYGICHECMLKSQPTTV